MTAYNAKTWWQAWERGEVRAGDTVTGDVVNDMMEILPPACCCTECAQLGEPYAHTQFFGWKPLFLTWRLAARKNDASRGIGALHSAWGEHAIWEFRGACLAGETTNLVAGFEPTRTEAIV